MQRCVRLLVRRQLHDGVTMAKLGAPIIGALLLAAAFALLDSLAGWGLTEQLLDRWL